MAADKTPGRAAYEAHWLGRPPVPWEELSRDDRAVWDATAAAAVTTTITALQGQVDAAYLARDEMAGRLAAAVIELLGTIPASAVKALAADLEAEGNAEIAAVDHSEGTLAFETALGHGDGLKHAAERLRVLAEAHEACGSCNCGQSPRANGPCATPSVPPVPSIPSREGNPT
jgi:hypothetical protein